MSSSPGIVADDALAVPAFAEQGWEVIAMPWDQLAAAPAGCDAALIRSTWDYHRDPAAFLDALEEMGRAGISVFNATDLVRWNVDKRYLEDLAQQGVPVVPTLYLDRLESGTLPDLFPRLSAEQVVLKPLVGCNAEGAFRLAVATGDAREAYVHYENRPLLAQPFVRAVVEEGEFSLFYFDGRFSHAVLKSPARGDYRVQEEHGAAIAPATPGAALLRAGEAAVAALEGPPLYARVDLVRANHGDGYWLMELEVVEPSLYLRASPDAPRRLAKAFVKAMEGL